MRKDASGALGPIVWIHNNSGVGNAGAALDFTTWSINPQVRLLATDAGGGYSHLAILTGANGTLSEKLRLLYDGRLGIGTSTPANYVSVSGNASIGVGYIGTAAPTNGLIVEGGVGIGTSNVPAGSKLNVVGGSFFLNTSTNQSTEGTTIKSPDGTWVNVCPSVGNGSWGNLSAAGDSAIIFGRSSVDTGSLVIAPWHTGSGKGIKIMADGKVGIGTTTPANTLDVNGQVRIAQHLIPSVGSAATNGIVWPSDPGGGGGDLAWLKYYVDGTGEDTKLQIGISNDADDDIEFYQAGAARMNIYNGNVGIGTAAPAYPLDVNGTIRSSSGGFVFPDGTTQTTAASSSSAAAPNGQTGTTYTLTSADNGKVITLNNASAITLTLPALTAGFNCMIVQLGAGAVTISGSGVTIYNRNGLTQTAGQYAVVTIVYLTSSTAVTSGDMQ
ncbi:hypothetical protein EB093_08235 [bacterium]|nr:hypothetical protein [bacterium]